MRGAVVEMKKDVDAPVRKSPYRTGKSSKANVTTTSRDSRKERLAPATLTQGQTETHARAPAITTLSSPARRGRPSKLKLAPAIPDPGTRQVILEAALEAFSREGFEGASLPSIAKVANVGHPLIHYYFGSKDNLWRTTVEYAFGDLTREAETIDRAARDLSPLDRLRVLIRALTMFAARHPRHLGLVMSEARSQSDRMKWLLHNYTDIFVRHLRKTLLEARDAGQIKDVPVGHLGFIIMGAVLFFFSLDFETPIEDMEQSADRHASLVLETILHGVAL